MYIAWACYCNRSLQRRETVESMASMLCFLVSDNVFFCRYFACVKINVDETFSEYN